MRKIFILAVIIVLSITGIVKGNQKLPTKHLLEYSDYQKITPENIKTLKIRKYTEGGLIETDITDKKEINKIYQYLNGIKLTSETNMGCDDNTTVYSFVLQDNTKVSIEKECDWIVINGKHYKFSQNTSAKRF